MLSDGVALEFSRPACGGGHYVMPVSLIDEIFGVDAVLDLEFTQSGSSYRVLVSTTIDEVWRGLKCWNRRPALEWSQWGSRRAVVARL